MTCTLLKGKPVAERIYAHIGRLLETSPADIHPRLLIVRFGEDEDMLSYERSLVRAGQRIGVEVDVACFSPTIDPESARVALIDLAQENPHAAVLVFRPLPIHLEQAMYPEGFFQGRCVDVIEPAALLPKHPDLHAKIPCTAEAVREMLDYYQISLAGKEVCVVGRSEVVGFPAACLCIQQDATVTLCHGKTKDLESHARRADVIILATGVAGCLSAGALKQSAVVIDCGMHFDETTQGYVGDLALGDDLHRLGAYTPAIGGIGAVTTALLMRQTVQVCLDASKGTLCQ